MAVFRKAPEPEVKRHAVIASAARYSFGDAQTWVNIPTGDRRWQREAWRQYDQTGELRFALWWKGNAMSQATLFCADVDPDTGRPAGPTDNETAREITAGILGGPVQLSQRVRTISINLDLVGEIYAFLISGKDKDEWFVLSGTEVSMQGKTIKYVHPSTGAEAVLGGNDLMIRIWMPHAELQYNADSTVRALLPTLREIEKSSQNIAARLDSRLASAGLLLVPENVDFPDGDDDPEAPTGLMGQLARAMGASMQDPGSAAAQVPIVLQADKDDLDGIEHMSFETPVSKEIIELRESAIKRFATGMDIPRERLEGMGDASHWSSWQVAEETYKTHLLPILDLISDALTQAYLHPALIAAKVPNPELYLLQFDGSSIIGEPNPLDEALQLFDRGIITAEAVRILTSTPEEYAPAGDEKRRALAERLVTNAPTLFQQPELARILGFGEPAQTGNVPAGTTPAAVEGPSQSQQKQPPDTQGGQPAAVTASGDLSVASIAVTFALERAANRMLNTQRLKDEFSNVPRHELHTRFKPEPSRHDALLEGAWRHVPRLAAQYRLDGYVRALMATGAPHSDSNLAEWVSRG